PALLRARRARAKQHRRRRHAAEKREEKAAVRDHSITSSARSKKASGMLSPIALAALRLTTSSNLVGNCTGSSLPLAPPRRRSPEGATGREMSAKSAPYDMRPPAAAMVRDG